MADRTLISDTHRRVAAAAAAAAANELTRETGSSDPLNRFPALKGEQAMS